MIDWNILIKYFLMISTGACIGWFMKTIYVGLSKNFRDKHKTFVFEIILFGIILLSLMISGSWILSNTSEDHDICYDLSNKILDYNGTFYGGYNCYDRNDHQDIYFTPYDDFEDPNMTYFIKCYFGEDSCMIITKYLKVGGL